MLFLLCRVIIMCVPLSAGAHRPRCLLTGGAAEDEQSGAGEGGDRAQGEGHAVAALPAALNGQDPAGD